MALALKPREKKEMAHQAFVLINCDLGYEVEILDQLRDMDSVVEAHGTFGAYDIIAEVAAESHELLRETITWQIRKLNRIRSTLTLKCIDGQN